MKAKDGIHKYVAIFEMKTGRLKRVPFGALGYNDFIKYSATLSKEEAEKKKQMYLKRHSGMGEDWNQYDTPGALSRHILWNKPTLSESLEAFRKLVG